MVLYGVFSLVCKGLHYNQGQVEMLRRVSADCEKVQCVCVYMCMYVVPNWKKNDNNNSTRNYPIAHPSRLDHLVWRLAGLWVACRFESRSGWIFSLI